MQTYDSAQFDPPAPIAHVKVTSQLLGTVIQQVPMLLDTGADVSLLPRAHVESLVSSAATEYELEAFDGTRSMAQAVTVELEFLGKTFRGQYLLTNNWYGVLGRNVL